MTANSRRPGFRLPWIDDPPVSDEALDASAAAMGTPMGDAPGPGEQSGELASVPTPGAPDAAGPVAAGPDAAGGDAPASDEFLHSLVAAMRGVAEESRDANLADLRRDVDERIEQLRASAAQRAEELRRGSELDIAATADWEKAEMDRVRVEAERRVGAKRAELERQLADHQAASDREIEATRTRLADYERELTEFFSQLAEIRDPAVFVATAKRMPRGPDLETATSAVPPQLTPATAAGAEPAPAAAGSLAEMAATRASLLPSAEPQSEQPQSEQPQSEQPQSNAPQTAEAPSAEAPSAEAPSAEAPSAEAPSAEAPSAEPAAGTPSDTSMRLAERLAELDDRLSQAGSNGESAAASSVPTMPPTPTAAESEAAPAEADATEGDATDGDATEGDATDGEQSTPIMVKGLGSFGAITSFKQALERADGIRGVTLSLGPGGEFVYRASHAPGFDLAGAIRAIEGQGASIDETDGSLLVTINRGR